MSSEPRKIRGETQKIRGDEKNLGHIPRKKNFFEFFLLKIFLSEHKKYLKTSKNPRKSKKPRTKSEEIKKISEKIRGNQKNLG